MAIDSAGLDNSSDVGTYEEAAGNFKEMLTQNLPDLNIEVTLDQTGIQVKVPDIMHYQVVRRDMPFHDADCVASLVTRILINNFVSCDEQLSEAIVAICERPLEKLVCVDGNKAYRSPLSDKPRTVSNLNIGLSCTDENFLRLSIYAELERPNYPVVVANGFAEIVLNNGKATIKGRFKTETKYKDKDVAAGFQRRNENSRNTADQYISHSGSNASNGGHWSGLNRR